MHVEKKNKSTWEYNRWENKNDFDENKMNIILKLCDTEMENINNWNKGDYRYNHWDTWWEEIRV